MPGDGKRGGSRAGAGRPNKAAQAAKAPGQRTQQFSTAGGSYVRTPQSAQRLKTTGALPPRLPASTGARPTEVDSGSCAGAGVGPSVISVVVATGASDARKVPTVGGDHPSAGVIGSVLKVAEDTEEQSAAGVSSATPRTATLAASDQSHPGGVRSSRPPLSPCISPSSIPTFVPTSTIKPIATTGHVPTTSPLPSSAATPTPMPDCSDGRGQPGERAARSAATSASVPVASTPPLHVSSTRSAASTGSSYAARSDVYGDASVSRGGGGVPGGLTHLLDQDDPVDESDQEDETSDVGDGDDNDDGTVPGVNGLDASIPPDEDGGCSATGRPRSASSAAANNETAASTDPALKGLYNPVAAYLQNAKVTIIKDRNFIKKQKTFTINPPNPIAAQQSADPIAFCLPTIKVYLPHDLKGGPKVQCPNCGSRHVYSDGYSPYRRVIDLDECFFAITKRYECRAGHTADKYFMAWDPRLLATVPAYVRHTFPVILTHRLAVSQIVFDTMRTMVVNGMGIDSFAAYMRENHTRQHHRKEQAYLSRLSEMVSEQDVDLGRLPVFTQEQAKNLPHFPAFNDPLGYNGCYGSPSFYRNLYSEVMQQLEEDMKMRSAMLSGRFFSGDHFFKIIEANFKFKGKKLFVSVYSLLNEFTEVMSVQLALTRSLEELRNMMQAMQQRMVALGLPPAQVEVFFTDNPQADAHFLEGIFPGLGAIKKTVYTSPDTTASSTAVFPPLEFPSNHSIVYEAATAAADRAVGIFREQLQTAEGPPIIGLDGEWKVVRGAAARGPSMTIDVLQLSHGNMTLVLHLSRMRSMPSQRRIL